MSRCLLLESQRPQCRRGMKKAGKKRKRNNDSHDSNIKCRSPSQPNEQHTGILNMDVGACIYNGTMQRSDSPCCLIAHLDTLHIIAHPSVHLGHHQGDYTGATKRGVPCLLMVFSRGGFRRQLNGALSDRHCLLIRHTIRFTHSSNKLISVAFI